MSASDVLVTIEDGRLTFVYEDAVAGLLTLGDATTTRVSHVEPAAEGGWTAAMVDGPVLGPFTLRSDALTAERAWLRAHLGL